MAWLFLPPQCLDSASSASAPESEGSNSDSSSPSQEPAPFVTLSGTATQRPLSWRGWRTRPWIRRLTGMTLPPSTAARGVAEWISSLPVSPAPQPHEPESGEEPPTSDGFGKTSSSFSVRSAHSSPSSRTCLDCSRSLVPGTVAYLDSARIWRRPQTSLLEGPSPRFSAHHAISVRPFGVIAALGSYQLSVGRLKHGMISAHTMIRYRRAPALAEERLWRLHQ